MQKGVLQCKRKKGDDENGQKGEMVMWEEVVDFDVWRWKEGVQNEVVMATRKEIYIDVS